MPLHSNSGVWLRAVLTPTVALSLLGWSGLGSVASAQEGQTSPADKAPATAPAPAEPQIPRLMDGFEAGSVEKFWLPGNYGTGLYVPGAIRVSDKFARSGKQSVEITVREGNIEAAGDAGTTVERSELDSGHFNLMGRERWYGFSVLVPRDFPIVDTRLVISSCK